MDVRSLWKAVPLEKRKDIWSRALFRLLWCSAGGAVAILVINRAPERTSSVREVAVLVCVIAGMGVLVDALRLLLRTKRNS
jgi:pimeloyl-ACP methyl ester carboxylesterase